jgi:hypothetical protein
MELKIMFFSTNKQKKKSFLVSIIIIKKNI